MRVQGGGEELIMTRSGFAAVAVAAVGLAMFGVPSVASANPCFLPGNCRYDTQVVALTGSGGLFHSFRYDDGGAWTSLAPVSGQTGNAGAPVTDTSAALVVGDLYVAEVTGDGGLFYAVRNFDGSWTRIADVKAMAGDPGQVVAVAVATVQRSVHFVVRTADGGLHHAIRAADGEWTAFADISGATSSPGAVTDVAAVGIGDQLQLLAATGNGGLYHAVRDGSGAWTPLRDVKVMTGNPGQVARTAVARADGELQILVGTANGGLYHAIRHAGGSWTAIGNVKQVAGNPGAVVDVAAGAAWGVDGGGRDGQVQIAVAAGGGGLYHAIRYADGSWTTLGNVKAMAGDPGRVTRVGFSG
jgi:hypothetical protein